LNICNKSEDEVLRLLISKLPRMDRLSCQYIKKDDSICEQGCWHKAGFVRHHKARPKKICPICNEETYSRTGICSTHGGIYDHAWCESKKTKTESMMVRF
jgi:hypothetical protein